MRYEILDGQTVVNTILADAAFMEAHYPQANYREVETGEHYWISGCHKDGQDRLYGERVPVEIDEDVLEEYWTEIRGLPAQRHRKVA